MKRPPPKRIDHILGQLGLHPNELDPEKFVAEFDSPGTARSANRIGPCGKNCYSSQSKTRKAGNIRKLLGANTSFFRPYFCPDCKAWHLTSTKNPGSNPSSTPNRNAGHQRRNHSVPHSSDEP